MKVPLKSLVALHDNPKLVIDVGGYKGDYCDEVIKRFNCKVLIFEPIEEYAQICRDRFKENPNVRVIQTALGNGHSRPMYKSKNCSSFYNVADEIETVPVGLLSDFLTEDVDLIKLNCEGAEYEILQNLIDTGWLPRIPELLIQFHKGNKEKMMEELSKTHNLIPAPKWTLWKIK